MTTRFLRRKAPCRRRLPQGVPRNLPPHLMRDIGLCPAPERARLPLLPLW